jgi:hypothetical protein
MEVPVAEQSSAVAMFRALVMLVCMIAIPLAALFGSSLPDAIKALREGRWPKLTVGAGQESTPGKDPARLEEPPKFQPDAGAVAIHPAPIPPSPALASPVPTTDPARTPLPLGPPNMPATWPGETAQRPGAGVVPAHFETTADPNVPPAVPRKGDSPIFADTKTGTVPSPPAETDRFTQIQNRLRQLGATYYLLESMGGPQPMYRFHCRMAVGGNPNITRPFEATDAEPLRAMSQVLQQVEAWGSGPR